MVRAAFVGGGGDGSVLLNQGGMSPDCVANHLSLVSHQALELPVGEQLPLAAVEDVGDEFVSVGAAVDGVDRGVIEEPYVPLIGWVPPLPRSRKACESGVLETPLMLKPAGKHLEKARWRLRFRLGGVDVPLPTLDPEPSRPLKVKPPSGSRFARRLARRRLRQWVDLSRLPNGRSLEDRPIVDHLSDDERSERPGDCVSKFTCIS
jgi:hypothetical protein